MKALIVEGGGNQAWETPPELFQQIDNLYGFSVDGAASKENTKCKVFYDESLDAFSMRPVGERIWCNPPYSNMAPWVDLFIEWQKLGNFVAVLCQDRTDTKWFSKLWEHAQDVWFFTPRINFVGTKTGNNRGSALLTLDPAFFTPGNHERRVDIWNWKK